VRSIIDFYFVGFLSSTLSGVSRPADLHDRHPRGSSLSAAKNSGTTLYSVDP
jgi:hypothetical protein